MPEKLVRKRRYPTVLFRALIVWLLISMALMGCTAHEPYPAEWSSLVVPTGINCQITPTVYRNLNRERWGQSGLVDILLDENHVSFLKTVFVSISQPGQNQLNVGLYNAKGQCIFKKTLLFANGDYKCVDGWLQRGGATESNEGGFRGKENYSYLLTQQDGYFIYKKTYSSKGWFGVIPIRGSGTSWGRFKSTNYLYKIHGPGDKIFNPADTEPSNCHLTIAD